MIAKKLDNSIAPTISTATYSNDDILSEKDGLFVTKIITDRNVFGNIVKIQSGEDSTPNRKKRGDYAFQFCSRFCSIWSELFRMPLL